MKLLIKAAFFLRFCYQISNIAFIFRDLIQKIYCKNTSNKHSWNHKYSPSEIVPKQHRLVALGWEQHLEVQPTESLVLPGEATLYQNCIELQTPPWWGSVHVPFTTAITASSENWWTNLDDNVHDSDPQMKRTNKRN